MWTQNGEKKQKHINNFYGLVEAPRSHEEYLGLLE